LPKDASASVNAKTTSFLIKMEIAILAVLMRLFQMDNAPAKQDIPEIHVEFALSHAQMDNLSSKEPVPAALSIPSTTPPSMAAHAPVVFTWMHMESAKNLP